MFLRNGGTSVLLRLGQMWLTSLMHEARSGRNTAFAEPDFCSLRSVIHTMGYASAVLRRPVLPMLIFGLLDASYWCWGAYRPGCTGHEVRMLLLFTMPAGAGGSSSDPAWFAALVMTLPPVMIFGSDIWREGLIGYGVLYLANIGFVLMGRAVRQGVVIPLTWKLWPSWRERPARA